MDLSGVDLHFEAQDYVMTPYADLRICEEIDNDFFWGVGGGGGGNHATVCRILVSWPMIDFQPLGDNESAES